MADCTSDRCKGTCVENMTPEQAEKFNEAVSDALGILKDGLRDLIDDSEISAAMCLVTYATSVFVVDMLKDMALLSATSHERSPEYAQACSFALLRALMDPTNGHNVIPDSPDIRGAWEKLEEAISQKLLQESPATPRKDLDSSRRLFIVPESKTKH